MKFSQTQKNGSQDPKLLGALKKRSEEKQAISKRQAQGLIVALLERKHSAQKMMTIRQRDRHVGGSGISHFPPDLASRYLAVQCWEPAEEIREL
jgi:hypothetical protein